MATLQGLGGSGLIWLDAIETLTVESVFRFTYSPSRPPDALLSGQGFLHAIIPTLHLCLAFAGCAETVSSKLAQACLWQWQHMAQHRND